MSSIFFARLLFCNLLIGVATAQHCTMNESSENKDATSQPPRYANLVHQAKAPPKKRFARSSSRSGDKNVSKNDPLKSYIEPGDGGDMKPAAKQ